MSLNDYALKRKIEDENERLQREKRKEIQERADLIEQAKDRVITDFWCDICKKDFKSLGYKSVVHYNSGIIAKYVSKCPKGHEVIRYITDKSNDPYFSLSERIKIEKTLFAKDLLQPGQPGFSTLYGDPNKEYYKRLEKEEKANYERQRN